MNKEIKTKNTSNEQETAAITDNKHSYGNTELLSKYTDNQPRATLTKYLEPCIRKKKTRMKCIKITMGMNETSESQHDDTIRLLA